VRASSRRLQAIAMPERGASHKHDHSDMFWWAWLQFPCTHFLRTHCCCSCCSCCNTRGRTSLQSGLLAYLGARLRCPRPPAPAISPRSFQCEQTLHGTGCTDVPAGVCGKTADVANLQDLLTFQLKGAYYRGSRLGSVGTAWRHSWRASAMLTACVKRVQAACAMRNAPCRLHASRATPALHGPCTHLLAILQCLPGLSAWTHFAHQNGVETPDIDSFVKAAVFSTLTNVSRGASRGGHPASKVGMGMSCSLPLRGWGWWLGA
jgi:hypothetical protein